MAWCASHEDLERRLVELGEVDGSNFDRIVAFDPLIAAIRRPRAAGLARYPAAGRRPLLPPRHGARLDRAPLFVGRSTEHRRRLLTEAKHRFDVLHLAFGVGAARLERVMDEHWSAHQHPQRALSELREPRRLAPCRGSSRDQRAAEPEPRPGVGHRLPRVPERLPPRAHPGGPPSRRHACGTPCGCAGGARPSSSAPSRVYPRIVADLLADVRAFGSRATACGLELFGDARRRAREDDVAATASGDRDESGSGIERDPPIAAPRLGCEGRRTRSVPAAAWPRTG